MQWSYRGNKLLLKMTRWTQKWDKPISGPSHSTAPITSRSMLWQPRGVAINQPAAVLSNSQPTHSVPLGVIADHHTWQLDHRVIFFRLTGTEIQAANRGPVPSSNKRRWSQCVTPQQQLWPFLSAISLWIRQAEIERIKITALQPFPCLSFLP